MSKKEERLFEIFRKRAKEEGIDLEQIKTHIPSSIEAFDFADEIYIQGISKLKEELASACSIPENDRRVIDPRYLEQ
jgi:hypothetical protein